MFYEFLQELGPIRNAEIPFPFRNQFKIKDNFINPNSKHFDSIIQKLLSEDKAGIKRKWDKQCKMMFIWVLGKFFQLKNKKTINPNQEEWIQLSQILSIDETTLKQRWITLINPVAKSINWDPEEDEIIRSLMNEQDEKHIWTQIALELYNQNNGQYIRTPKQVRERWMNYLNPKLKKTNWSQQEDLQLLNMVVKNGKRWSLISSLLDGRTENQVKNRFKSLIQKIYKDEEDDDIEELQAIKEYLNKQNIQPEQEPTKEEQQNRTHYSRQAKQKKEQQQPKQIEIVEVQQQKKRKFSSQIKDFLNLPKVMQVEKKEEQLPVDSLNDFQLDQPPKPIIQENNKKDLSTPNTLNYYFQSQMLDDLKNDQFRLKQIQQSPMQQVYPGFQEIQQTPVQMFMGQYLKNYQQSQNLISPFPLINQTPMVYTPAQPMFMNYNPCMGVSPLLMRSPYQENMSPQPPQQFWQQTPIQQTVDQAEKQQQQFNIKLEFLKSNNLVDQWKQKRNNEKQNPSSIFDSAQQLDQ